MKLKESRQPRFVTFFLFQMISGAQLATEMLIFKIKPQTESACSTCLWGYRDKTVFKCLFFFKAEFAGTNAPVQYTNNPISVLLQ